MLPEGVPETFWRDLAKAIRCVLMLDYDGTLAPFREDREKAFPYPGLTEAVDRIMEDRDTRVVVISGRWTRDLLGLFPLQRMPEMFGSHGIERLFPDGRYQVLDLDEKVVAGLAEIDNMAIRGGHEERIERKPGCLALHWRGLDPGSVERMRRIVREDWERITTDGGLLVAEFNGGIEIRAPGRHKGDAVRAVLEEEPEGTVAAYLGDDRTDEDAFKAMKGHGLGILVAGDSRPSEASVRLSAPEGILDFLCRWAKARSEHAEEQEKVKR
jgi:trehalose-phosphatase